MCRVVFVGDRCHETAIKGGKRQGEGAITTVPMSIYVKERRVPKQWKKFLSSGSNKELLLKYLCDQFQKQRLPEASGLCLYTTKEDRCIKRTYSTDVLLQLA